MPGGEVRGSVTRWHILFQSRPANNEKLQCGFIHVSKGAVQFENVKVRKLMFSHDESFCRSLPCVQLIGGRAEIITLHTAHCTCEGQPHAAVCGQTVWVQCSARVHSRFSKTAYAIDWGSHPFEKRSCKSTWKWHFSLHLFIMLQHELLNFKTYWLPSFSYNTN